MNVLFVLLLLVALVLFLVEAVARPASKVNLVALGLASVAGAFLVQHLS